MRLNPTRAAVVCCALVLLASTAVAGPCGGERRGPVRALLGGLADRVHERREARHTSAAPSCSTAPQSQPVTYAAPQVGQVGYTAAPSCANGRCPLPR